MRYALALSLFTLSAVAQCVMVYYPPAGPKKPATFACVPWPPVTVAPPGSVREVQDVFMVSIPPSTGQNPNPVTGANFELTQPNAYNLKVFWNGLLATSNYVVTPDATDRTRLWLWLPYVGSGDTITAVYNY